MIQSNDSHLPTNDVPTIPQSLWNDGMRNNINSMVICQPVGIEPRVEQRSTKAKAGNLVFVPNPANDFVSIFTGKAKSSLQ